MLPYSYLNNQFFFSQDINKRLTVLKPGDTILLISDGLSELKNNQEEMFGYKVVRNAFEEIAKRTPEETISHLKDQSSAWVADEDPDDDVTFVGIKVKECLQKMEYYYRAVVQIHRGEELING